MGGLADPGSPAAWLDLTVGVGLVAAGFLAWWRRPASTTGLWIWLASSLWLVAYPYPAASLWHRVPLVVAVLTFPATGRSPTAVVPIIIVAALAVATPSGQNGALAGVAAVLLGRPSRLPPHPGPVHRADPRRLPSVGHGADLAAAFLVGPLLRLVDPIAAPAASAPSRVCPPHRRGRRVARRGDCARRRRNRCSPTDRRRRAGSPRDAFAGRATGR